MFKSVRSINFLANHKKAAVFATVTLTLALLLATISMTASYQRGQNDPERGIQELRSLVVTASGRPAAADLQRIESMYPQTRAASLARFLRGYLYYSGQNYSAAADALDMRLIEAYSSLGDYALFYRAESEAGAGAKGDALRDYGLVYTRHPDSLMSRDARLRAAEMALALNDHDGAVKELAQMLEAGDADAAYLTAQAYEASGNSERAIRLYRKIYFEMPATRAAVQAESRLDALGAAIKDNPGAADELRSRADGLFRSKQYAEAALAYSDLIAARPETERDDEIQLRRGVSLLNSKQAAQAVASLTRVSGRNPDLQAEALFHQAEALRRAGRVPESAVVVDRMLSQHPKSRQSQAALYNLADYFDKQGRRQEASTRYRQLIFTYPRSEYAPEASYDLGWWAYQGKNYTEAARILEQHLANYRYPETKFIGEAGFWAGKSEELLGNKSRALALYDMVSERYRYGYHGHVAGQRAAALRAADPTLKPEPIKPGSDLETIRKNLLHVEKIQETADGSESKRIARANDLEIIGLNDFAVKELNEALESAPSSPKINLRLAQLYSRQGENFQATLVLRRAYPDLYSYRDSDLPRAAWEIFFPLHHWDIIKQEARRYGIDPYHAAGLIRQESVFNPKAISRVGARGLMQLMPGTGQQVAKSQGTGRVTAADLYNPVLNIRLGMNYLAQMVGQFGRIEYAAAGYNAGPGRAKRWLAERGSMDIEDWIENIPFTETRGYVQGVLRYAANYRRFYKE